MSRILTQIFSGIESSGLGGIGGFQAAQIDEVSSDVSRATVRADRATQKAIEAEQKFERLQIVTQAMWEILQERLEVTDEELESKIQEVDLRDGVADGKMGGEVAICGNCHRKTGVRHHRRCMYCGFELKARHVVER
ncbi:hypothetical protein [Roseibacillus persicicus]|uniref:hypothetical protein n=1 Tax=Roseibacillus persicicus TaxID=454148 RepID=UPI00280D946B|nr:hypothetical protein [Roseibacillus persicicus]MDQ8190961.1 hypothetical protein [Roseibacillus persicicus]